MIACIEVIPDKKHSFLVLFLLLLSCVSTSLFRFNRNASNIFSSFYISMQQFNRYLPGLSTTKCIHQRMIVGKTWFIHFVVSFGLLRPHLLCCAVCSQWLCRVIFFIYFMRLISFSLYYTFSYTKLIVTLACFAFFLIFCFLWSSFSFEIVGCYISCRWKCIIDFLVIRRHSIHTQTKLIRTWMYPANVFLTTKKCLVE